ncbi:MAG: hypothetical protein AMK71_03755 [Nitrospira bacterium SG8_35_4]|nr:MAG: hypothetical protein AMK71_03755 [Nitrospira bacterium SG8_35_4]
MNLVPKRECSLVTSSEKRAFKRINANIDARFFYGNIFYSGTVLNISEKGMFINTKRFLPSDSMFVIIIREGNALLKVIAKVRRYSVDSGSFYGMGVELLSPSADYVKFINRLKIGV